MLTTHSIATGLFALSRFACTSFQAFVPRGHFSRLASPGATIYAAMSFLHLLLPCESPLFQPYESSLDQGLMPWCAVPLRVYVRLCATVGHHLSWVCWMTGHILIIGLWHHWHAVLVNWGFCLFFLYSWCWCTLDHYSDATSMSGMSSAWCTRAFCMRLLLMCPSTMQTWLGAPSYGCPFILPFYWYNYACSHFLFYLH
jgi:hypothetical protein